MSSLPRTLKDLMVEHGWEVVASSPLLLRFGDCTILVRANRREIAVGLKEYFRSFLCPHGEPNIEITIMEQSSPDLAYDFRIKQPDPGKTKIKEESIELDDGRIVRKRLTGMVFLFGGGTNVAVGPALDNLNQVINFVNNRYIQWLLHRGCLLGHAAAVAAGDRGVAFAGFSGMGKSTLALHVMGTGADFVSNDRLLVRSGTAGVEMSGVPKQPRINPGTVINDRNLAGVIPPTDLHRLEAMPPDELWSLEQKYDAIIEDVYGPSRFRLDGAMTALILLNWQRDGGPMMPREVDLYQRRDLLPAFMKETGLFYQESEYQEPDAMSEEAYLAVLSRCRVYELAGGVNFQAATDLAESILRTGRADLAAWSESA